jgi:uncharacterized repeat protein (TIGR02543 family)
MKNKSSKLLALLMAVLMMVSLLPVSAAAASDTAITLETDAGYTLNVTESYGLWATKDISGVAEWSYTFYLENAGSGRYPYRIYAEHNGTKYYICADSSDNVKLTTDEQDANYFSASESSGKYTIQAAPHGRYTKSIMIDASNSSSIKVMLEERETGNYKTVYGHAAVERHELSYTWSYPDAWSSWALTGAPSLVSLAEGQTHQVDSTYQKGTKLTINGVTRVFSGWYLNKDWYDDLDGNCLAPGATITMGTENIQLYGRWEVPATYSVTYQWNCPDITNFTNELGELPAGQTGLTSGDTYDVDGRYSDGSTAVYNGEDFVFSGWYRGSDKVDGQTLTVGDENIVLSGTWSNNSPQTPAYIPVTYDVGDGTMVIDGTTYSGTNYYICDAREGQTTTKPAADPTLGGHRFLGWYTKDKETGEYSAEPFDFDTPINSELTLYARYVKQITVTYNHGGGSITIGGTTYSGDNYYSETVDAGPYYIPDGMTVTPPSKYHEFTNWSAKNDGQQYAYTFSNGSELIRDTTLAAGYVRTHFDLTFHPGKGTNGELAKLTVDSTVYDDNTPYTILQRQFTSIPNPTTPVLEDYDFLGWYTKDKESGEYSAEPYNFSTFASYMNPTDLYGRWEKKHTITFDPTFDQSFGPIFSEGGATMTVGTTEYPGANGELYTVKVSDGASYTIPGESSTPAVTVTAPEGYEFAGWATRGDNGELTPVGELTNIRDDVTLYAKYERIELRIVYDANGGQYTSNGVVYPNGIVERLGETVYYGDTSTAVFEDVSRLGYIFDGWFYTSGGVEYEFIPQATKVYSNLDVYAKWTERTATLTYDTYTEIPAGANGGYTGQSSETIGVVTGTPDGSEAIARPFYKFTGWYVGDTKVSDSAVLTKDVIDLYAKDSDGLYKDTTFTAHFTERVYTIDITKTVSRSQSSEKPGRAEFTFELNAIIGAIAIDNRDQTFDDAVMVYSTGIGTNGVGKYTGKITVHGSVLAGLGAGRSYFLSESNDGLRYWRYDTSVYQIAFDPNSDMVEISIMGRNGEASVVSAAAFENRYSRVENDTNFGRVEIIKVDEDDEDTYLEGAKFKLYESKTDRLVSAFETGRNGKDSSTVAEGSYYLVESASPEGYTRNTEPIKVTVKADKTTTVYVTNKRTDTPKSLNDIDHYAYIVGYPDGTVRPQGSITRAEVATIFFRLLTDNMRNQYLTDNNNYSDVNPSDWYCTAVSTLSKMGIINGYTDGTFNPGGYITRAEFAAIAARFELSGNTTEADFSDIYTHWAKKEISIAANNGWILGYEDGSFRPNQLITRAEAMTLVNRVLNRVPEDKSDLLRGMTEWTDNMNTAKWYYLAVQEATNSHEFERKANGYETWTELRVNRDWTEFER